MSIDFFDKTCQSQIAHPRFGLCDESQPSKEPAYIDINATNEETKWIAIVANPNKIEVTFTAIDNCIKIEESDGKRCDGMLTYKDCIIFVELKERKGKTRTWVKSGDEQLRNTIDIFSKNHSLSSYKSKQAYIANNKRPNFQASQIERMARFKEETGFRLKIENTISIT
jgi:predicted RNA-binding protein (virulence factor B family)